MKAVKILCALILVVVMLLSAVLGAIIDRVIVNRKLDVLAASMRALK